MVEKITVQATIKAPVERVWKLYTDPTHVTKWNAASDDWHTPSAENDVQVGGKFIYRMEAKDKSAGFDFTGTYTDIVEHERFAYVMEDRRNVQVVFDENRDTTKMTVTFDPEAQNSVEMQREGWQAILNNFKKYVEEM